MGTLEDIYASLMQEHEDAQAARRTAVDGETLPEDGTTLEALYAQRMAEHEAVSAANPYGCNQYGEGWAMPHNGMSRVPRGSVPKKSERKKFFEATDVKAQAGRNTASLVRRQKESLLG